MVTPLIVAGHVYSRGTTTAIENVVVTVLNKTTGEQHNGAEASFPELTTNSDGEFQANLANFTNTYSDGDVIQVTCVYGELMDLIEVTLDGTASISTLVLTPSDKEVYAYERALDKIGDKIIVYQSTITLDEDYGSVETYSLARHEVEDDTYASIQIAEDEVTLMDQGIVNHGEAVGFFKVRYNVNKDDIIRCPSDSDNLWVIQDRPVRRTFKNNSHHDEARLVRIESSYQVTASGSLAPFNTELFVIYKDGSDCTSTDGSTGRTLVTTTSAEASQARVYLDRQRLTLNTDYTISYSTTSFTITFVGKVWDDQKIAVDYLVEAE